MSGGGIPFRKLLPSYGRIVSVNLFDRDLSKSPLIRIFSYVVASCSTTVDLDVDTPVLGNISEDSFTHWRPADVPYIIFALEILLGVAGSCQHTQTNN